MMILRLSIKSYKPWCLPGW